MSRGARERHRTWPTIFPRKQIWGLTLAVLWALVFVRFCCLGLQYWPQLDDYIQYHNYTAYHADIWAWILQLGLLAARPLAGLMDVFVWSNFFPVMILAVAILSLLYAASACLFQWVWSRHFGTSQLFLVFYALLPLGIEGTYWVSASSRIVTGLFLVSVCMYAFERWCNEQGKPAWLILYWTAQLAAFCLYEQILVLGITGIFLLAFLHWRKNWRHASFALLTFVNIFIYFGFTSLFASGVYASRLQLQLPTSAGYWTDFLPTVFGQIWSAFVQAGWAICSKGFTRSIQLLNQMGMWWYLFLILFLSILLWWCVKSCKDAQSQQKWIALIVGGLMALAPVTIFLVLGNPWFSLRCTVPSYCGLALMADTIVLWLLQHVPQRRQMIAGLCGIFAVFFCLCTVSEIYDYHATWQNDQQFLSLLCEATQNGMLYEKKQRIGILGVEPSFLEDQNYYYHEHIHGVTESSWALTGAAACVSGNGDFPTLIPLPIQQPMYTFSPEEFRLSTLDALYLYDAVKGTFVQVQQQKTGEETYDILALDGTILGHTWEEEGKGYFAWAQEEHT